jgi:SNF2 family DNA or RNA helicase
MAFAELSGDTILVQTTWGEKELIKQVPGALWKPEEQVWRVPLAWSSCVVMRGVFKHTLTVGPELNKWAFREREMRIDPAMATRVMTAPSIRATPELYPFQEAGVEYLGYAGDALLGDDMGTGKTIQALRALDESNAGGLPAIVISPNSVKRAWAREAGKWYPEAHVYTIEGSPAVKSKMLRQAADDPLALVLINIEAVRLHSRLAPYGSYRLKRCRECDKVNGEPNLKASACEVHPKILNTTPFRTVIIDEAHRIKDPKSKQTRACWAVMHSSSVQTRWALTGTPLANHPGDVWSIMHGVNKQDFPSRTKFVDRYCLQAWNAYGAMAVVGINPEHRDEFFKILDPRFRRMPKSLVLSQLPPKVRSQRLVDMSPKQSAAYRDIADGFLTRLDDGGLLVAPNNLAAQVRLLQLSSSYCQVEKDDDGVVTKVTLCEPSPKVDELELIMEELGDEPLVVAAESRQLIELASARLTKNGVAHGLITGAQNTWERERALAAFQSGSLRALLFTVKAGGTGLTMTRASTIVFLQRSWSMIDNKQSEDRVHRIGSEHHDHINIIDVVTRNTVEDMVQIPRLYDKLERLEEINRDRVLMAANADALAALDSDEEKILASNLGA